MNPECEGTQPKDCIICWDRPRSARFSCGHAVYCVTCVEQNRPEECPVCRSEIESIEEGNFNVTWTPPAETVSDLHVFDEAIEITEDDIPKYWGPPVLEEDADNENDKGNRKDDDEDADLPIRQESAGAETAAPVAAAEEAAPAEAEAEVVAEVAAVRGGGGGGGGGGGAVEAAAEEAAAEAFLLWPALGIGTLALLWHFSRSYEKEGRWNALRRCVRRLI